MQKLVICIAAAFLFASPIFSKGSGGRSSVRAGSRKSAGKSRGGAKIRAETGSRGSVECAGCARDGRGRIKRSAAAKRNFEKAHPCPATGKRSGACPGYVVDHIRPLKEGGADAPSNMEWQTEAAAKAKDKIE